MRSPLAGVLLVVTALVHGGCAAEDDAATVMPAEEQEVRTGPKLAYDEYSVLFTNPICRRYEYPKDQVVLSNAGERLTQKPENVFCGPADASPSGARDTSPQKKLIDWISDPETKEIFFAYLSFSNRTVSRALCDAIKERNVKVTMVLDRETELEVANQVLACKPGNGDASLAPRLELRGHDGTIGYAHNKVFMINPRSGSPRIVFSSGNLSSGVVLHHENWHFLRVSADTHFAKSHVCLMDGVLDHYKTKQEYSGFIRDCRNNAGAAEESDLRTYFVPGDGDRATGAIKDAIRASSFIGINAHRFSYGSLRGALEERLKNPSPVAIQLSVDDDLWWAGHGVAELPNTPDEFKNVKDLEREGVDVRYLQTNHGAGYLHHNKFIVFNGNGESVFAGAGNFTGTAFSDNFENFYFITVPHVVDAMKAQQKHLFDLATQERDLPRENVLPSTDR